MIYNKLGFIHTDTKRSMSSVFAVLVSYSLLGLPKEQRIRKIA
jgi:hypothetical protein